MSTESWNPEHNSYIRNGLIITRPNSDNGTDMIKAHRSIPRGTLVLNCEERREGDVPNFADIILTPDDAIAFAEWILANFKKGEKTK